MPTLVELRQTRDAAKRAYDLANDAFEEAFLATARFKVGDRVLHANAWTQKELFEVCSVHVSRGWHHTDELRYRVLNVKKDGRVGRRAHVFSESTLEKAD